MRLVPKSATIVLAISISLASALQAQTLRPLETESAVLLPSGATQISIGTSYSRNGRFPAFTAPDFLRSQDLVTAPEVEIRIGAGGWAEIQVRYEFLYLDEQLRSGKSSDQFGGGDAELFTKVRFLRERENVPALGAIFGVKLPNADRGDRLGTDETDFSLLLLASKEVGPVTAHLNLGLEILGNPGKLNGDLDESGSGQDDPFNYSLALVSRPLFPSAAGPYDIRLLGSIEGKEGSRFDNDGNTVRLGTQVTRSGWTFYAGASAGLSGATEDFGLRGGLTYAFELERLFD